MMNQKKGSHRDHREDTERKEKFEMFAELTEKIIGAAIKVHSELGPGMFESVYEECLCYELSMVGIKYERQVPIPISYKGLTIPSAFKADVIVENKVIVELKAVESLTKLFESQILTYMRFTDCHVGLLVNFRVNLLKSGIKRFVL